MSDFLTRLVQRQWGELPTIQPRVSASLSLPDAPAGNVAENVGSAWQEFGRKGEGSPRRWGREPSGFSELPVVQSDADRWATDRRTSVGRVDHVSEARADPPSSATEVNGATVFVQEFAGEHADFAGHLKSLRHLARLPEPSSESPARDGIRPTDRPLLQLQQPATASLNPLSDTTSQPAHSIRSRSAARSFWEQPEVSAPPSLLGSQALPERARTPEVSSEPPVQVTIGRIEVTALTSPQPARRASQPRKPSLSLRDYLAQRQGGKP